MKTKPTPDSAATLSDRLAMAREDVVIAAAAVDTAEAAYRSALLTETPAALRKLADAKTDAGIAVDRAAALVTKLERDLADAVKAEAEAIRHGQYERASALAQSALDRLASEYTAAAEKIRAVLGAVAAADIAAEAANQNLPAGAAPIGKPSSAFSIAGISEEIISSARVELWSGAGDDKPLPDELQAKVTGREPNASVRMGDDPHREMKVVRRTFNRIEKLPVVNARYAPHLPSLVTLPGLAVAESDYWKPVTTPADAIAQADAPRRLGLTAVPREPVVTYQLVRNPQSHSGAAAEIEA